MTGHTNWNELRDRVYAERPGMAERVAVERARAVAEMADSEAWEIELQAEAGDRLPPEEQLRARLVEAVGENVEVLDAEVRVRTESGRPILWVTLAIVIGIGAFAAAKRFSQADQTANVLRLQVQEYGPIVAQTIRRAA
jgi:hypothetical protein